MFSQKLLVVFKRYVKFEKVSALSPIELQIHANIIHFCKCGKYVQIFFMFTRQGQILFYIRSSGKLNLKCLILSQTVKNITQSIGRPFFGKELHHQYDMHFLKANGMQITIVRLKRQVVLRVYNIKFQKTDLCIKANASKKIFFYLFTFSCSQAQV